MKNILIVLLGIIVMFIACNNTSDSTENKIASKTELEGKNKLVQKEKTIATDNKLQKASNKKEVVGNGKINWVDIEEVEKLIKQQPKKILIDAYTSWCGWCKRMDKNTFENPTIAKYVNDNFYAVKLNAESKESINFKGKNYEFVKGGRRGYNALAKELLKGRMSYPTISFLDENLNLINAFPGYKSPQKFDALMNYINENEFQNVGFTQYKTSFKSEIPEEAKSTTSTKNNTNSKTENKLITKPQLKRKANIKKQNKVVKPKLVKPQNKVLKKPANKEM